jgi:hypothetical protein
MNISGFTVIRNGVSLGYPFVESILSLLPLCDELVISEGYSEDETYSWLERLQKRYPEKIRLYQERWPGEMPGGQAIGEMQTRTLKKCRGRWVYLLQADEIMPQENIPYLQELCSPRRPIEHLIGRRRFNSYNVDFAHIIDGFQRYDPNPGYRWAIRLARNRSRVYSGGDGWQLEGRGCSLIGVARLPKPILHAGYNFPVNTWRKWVNHAQLYANHEDYQERGRIARLRLAEYEQGVLPSSATTNPLELPLLIAPLIGRLEYQVREELLS